MSRMYVVFEGSSQMSQNRIEDIDGIDKHDHSLHTSSTVFFLIHLTVLFVVPIIIGCIELSLFCPTTENTRVQILLAWH